MLRTTHIAAALALTAFAAAPLVLGPAAIAQGDPIAERQAIMEDVGGATRTGVQMVRGERDFDLEAARNTFAVYLDASQRMPELFPEGTETGGDTEALPAIWEDKAEFVALFEEFGERAQAGLDDTTDAATFQAALGTATQSCRTCHEQFRMQN